MIEGVPTKQQQLVDYVIKNLRKGYTADTLKYALLSQGCSRTSVNKAIEQAEKKVAEDKPKITHTVYTERKADAPTIIAEPHPTLWQKIKSIFGK